ncbi:MAG: hypothetical protein QXL51_01335 [Candidatus Aenigmatarchaeota archaeon]
MNEEEIKNIVYETFLSMFVVCKDCGVVFKVKEKGFKCVYCPVCRARN